MTLFDLSREFFSYLVSFREQAPTSNPPRLINVRADLESILARMDTQAKADLALNSSYEWVRPVLVVFADEILTGSGWGHSDKWRENNLELRHYGASEGGRRYFRMLSELDEAPKDVVAVFYLCLALGFHGPLEPGDPKLEQIKSQLAQRLPKPPSKNNHSRPGPFSAQAASKSEPFMEEFEDDFVPLEDDYDDDLYEERTSSWPTWVGLIALSLSVFLALGLGYTYWPELEALWRGDNSSMQAQQKADALFTPDPAPDAPKANPKMAPEQSPETSVPAETELAALKPVGSEAGGEAAAQKNKTTRLQGAGLTQNKAQKSEAQTEKSTKPPAEPEVDIPTASDQKPPPKIMPPKKAAKPASPEHAAKTGPVKPPAPPVPAASPEPKKAKPSKAEMKPEIAPKPKEAEPQKTEKKPEPAPKAVGAKKKKLIIVQPLGSTLELVESGPVEVSTAEPSMDEPEKKAVSASGDQPVSRKEPGANLENDQTPAGQDKTMPAKTALKPGAAAEQGKPGSTPESPDAAGKGPAEPNAPLAPAVKALPQFELDQPRTEKPTPQKTAALKAPSAQDQIPQAKEEPRFILKPSPDAGSGSLGGTNQKAEPSGPDKAKAASGSPDAAKSKPSPGKAAAKPGEIVYFLQVGSFNEPKGAKRLIAKIKQHGFTALLVPKARRDGKGFWQVVVCGPYKTKAEANQEREAILEKAGYKAITRFKPLAEWP